MYFYMFNYNRIVCMNNEYVQKFNCLKLKICQYGSVICRTYWQAFNTLPLSALYIPSCILCLTQNIFLINTSTQVLASSTLPTLSHCQWRDVWWKDEIKVSSFGSNCSGDVQQSRRFYIPTVVPVVWQINKNILLTIFEPF